MQGQMVVMDVAAEYHGYSADVTRSVPATGTYSPEEKAIYQIVYDAQEAIFPLCKEGTPFDSLDSKAKQVLAAGLIKLGLITKASEVGTYYPHSCSHHMGLDVHDIAVEKSGRVVFVATGFGCLATVSDRASFAPLWRPALYCENREYC